MTPRRDASGLSAAHTKTGRLQRALLKQIAVTNVMERCRPATAFSSTSSNSSVWCRRFRPAHAGSTRI